MAARALGRDAGVDEGSAEALGLFLGGGAHVVCLDDGAESACRGDGLQARDTHTHDEHLGRGHRARGGHEHGEELGQLLGRLEAGAIARHRRLRAPACPCPGRG